MTIIETFPNVRAPKGRRVPDAWRSDHDHTYEMGGVPINIKGLGNVVKSGTPRVPSGCTVVAYGCGLEDCPWFMRTTHPNDARGAFSEHQELHEKTPSMVPLVRVPPEIFAKLLKKSQKAEGGDDEEE